jgi:hypothetical protein
MGLTVITLEPKQPWEMVPYTIDFSRLSPFSAGVDKINNAAFAIFSSLDTSFLTDLTAMVGPISYTDTTATCRVGSGNDTAGTYILRCRVTCATTADQYEQECHFTVSQTT